MGREKGSGVRRKVLVIVSIAAVVFLAAVTLLGVWSAREMREQVGWQFNEQQLVIAMSVSELIERELDFLKKEISLLRSDLTAEPFDPRKKNNSIQKTLSRVLESGVWRIQILDLDDRKVYRCMPHKPCIATKIAEESLHELPHFESLTDETVWISEPQIRSSGIDLVLAMPLLGELQRILLFDVNVSWFLTPSLRNIRSGKTGYAWVIDGRGNFLFHPRVDFVGKNAFTTREEKYPSINYAMINYIQKERMLKGQAGTGWYYSFWHRGITGKIRKLIAHCPVNVSQNPLQQWSVAVVAPISEIEEFVHRGYSRQLRLQGLVILVIVLGASAIFFFENRWSRTLEKKVIQRTEALKKSEEKYRSLVESAEDFIFTVDSEGKFQSLNSFTANFFGGPPEGFVGESLTTLFPQKVAERQLKLVKLVYEFGKSVRDEFELEVGENQIWISGNFMPLKGEKGTVNAVLCIARDITENKNLERQLINAEKLASMGTLAAGVAHEINNPLGVILGFSDLLLRKTEKTTQEYEDLKTIERQGLHCKEVVENLLSFARVGEGNAEYSDLNRCVEKIIKVVKHTIEMSDIEFLVELSEHIPPVKGDSRELQQVFLNLINNAVGAMKHGGALTVRTSLDRKDRKAVIQFQDNGIGIRQEYMDHIYEPFFTTKPEGKGTGLGLFVSYGIITKHGGSISCVSNAGDSSDKPSGTTFTLKLPTKT